MEGNEVIDELNGILDSHSHIPKELFEKYEVKKGLRNEDSTGVLVGLTNIGDVHGYILDEGEKVPVEGRLRYRGINIVDLVKGFRKDKRKGFEETAYLLLFGELPNKEKLEEFESLINENEKLPERFIEDVILKAPSKDIMNELGRSVLALYFDDETPDDISTKNLLKQSINLIAKFPSLVSYAYKAKIRYHDDGSLVIHDPVKELCTAENFLHMIRSDSKYSPLEAEILDLALVLHAEHGGGNNSTFTVRSCSSSQTDTYAAISAGLGSLKGPLHGGAANQVKSMMENIKENVKDWQDDEEVRNYLVKILKKESHDKKGLIYGMGHAVYTLSDPRAILLKEKAFELSKEKNNLDEFNLYAKVEEQTPSAFKEVRGQDKILAPNVDFFSGFVYNMLDIPKELYTPIFAMGRVVGWCAHRIEELISSNKIMRPAYKNVLGEKNYIPMDKRG